MIFERSLQRELALTAFAVLMVLLALMLIAMMPRIIGHAAIDLVDPRDVLTLIGFTVLGYLPIILIVTLFIAVLFVLTRWYRDSEMVVWMASGISLLRFIKPVALFSAPWIIAIAYSSFVIWPWSREHIKLSYERFAQRDEIALLAPGQFRESPGSRRIFFIEEISPDAKQARNAFVASTDPEKISVVVARHGYIEVQPQGARFVVLGKGYRYDGLPGKTDYRIMEFQRYGVQVDTKHFVDVPTATSTGTLELLRNPTPFNVAELAWRAGLPLMAINLILLAIPLAHQNPRRSRFLHLVSAVLVYLTYSNLLNLVQSWLEQKRLLPSMGMWGLHVIAAVLTVALFWRRLRHRPVLKRLKKIKDETTQ